MFSPTFPDNFDDEVMYALERQLVPCWERSGFEHMVVATPTLSELYEQHLPERVVVWKGFVVRILFLTRSRPFLAFPVHRRASILILSGFPISFI